MLKQQEDLIDNNDSPKGGWDANKININPCRTA